MEMFFFLLLTPAPSWTNHAERFVCGYFLKSLPVSEDIFLQFGYSLLCRLAIDVYGSRCCTVVIAHILVTFM